MIKSFYFPVRRVVARFIDYLIWGMIGVVILGHSLSSPDDFIPFFYLFFFLYPFFEAFLLYRYKTTLGKRLLGIVVTNENGRSISFKKALLRSFLVFGAGFGFFLPYVSLILPIYALCRMVFGEFIFWDMQAKTKVDFTKTTVWDKVVLISFVAFLLLGWGLTLTKQLQSSKIDLTSLQDNFFENYSETTRIEMLKALNVDSVQSPKHARKAINELKNVQNLLQHQRQDFLSMVFEAQKKIDMVANFQKQNQLQAQLDLISKSADSFLFRQSVQMILFENILRHFAVAKATDFNYKNGDVFFKRQDLQYQYDRYMIQLQAFLENS